MMGILVIRLLTFFIPRVQGMNVDCPHLYALSFSIPRRLQLKNTRQPSPFFSSCTLQGIMSIVHCPLFCVQGLDVHCPSSNICVQGRPQPLCPFLPRPPSSLLQYHRCTSNGRPLWLYLNVHWDPLPPPPFDIRRRNGSSFLIMSLLNHFCSLILVFL